MEDPEKAIKLSEQVVEREINSRLITLDFEVREILDTGTEEDIIAVLKEANSLISLVCGDDNELYEEWRYRLFKDDIGKMHVIQGLEFDVEYYPDDEQKNDED